MKQTDMYRILYIDCLQNKSIVDEKHGKKREKERDLRIHSLRTIPEMFTVMSARWQVGGSGFRGRHGRPSFSIVFIAASFSSSSSSLPRSFFPFSLLTRKKDSVIPCSVLRRVDKSKNEARKEDPEQLRWEIRTRAMRKSDRLRTIR